MRTEIKIANILDKVKDLTQHMNGQEMENLRDELIAWLLFSDNEKSAIPHISQNMKGLTEVEKELIRKLASQTNDLYRASRNTDEEGD